MSVSDEHVSCAAAAYFRTKCWTASALRRPPCAVGNRILVPSSSPCSLIHAVSTMTVDLANGVHRSLRPFPSHRICAPLPRLTSCRRIEVLRHAVRHLAPGGRIVLSYLEHDEPSRTRALHAGLGWRKASAARNRLLNKPQLCEKAVRQRLAGYFPSRHMLERSVFERSGYRFAVKKTRQIRELLFGSDYQNRKGRCV